MHEAHEGHAAPNYDERGNDESARREDAPPKDALELEPQCRTCAFGPVPAACTAPGEPDVMHPSGLCRRYRYTKSSTEFPARRTPC